YPLKHHWLGGCLTASLGSASPTGNQSLSPSPGQRELRHYDGRLQLERCGGPPAGTIVAQAFLCGLSRATQVLSAAPCRLSMRLRSKSGTQSRRRDKSA